jgi:competence protein ComEA
MFKRFLKDYFTFNRSERNGLIVLLSILFLLIVARAAIPFLHSDSVTGFESFEDELALFERSLQTGEEAGIGEPSGSSSRPFLFDPNQATEQELLALGLERFVAGNIIKYREKGGRFASARDIKKIYGMTDEVYTSLEPFIRIRSRPVDPTESDLKMQSGSASPDGYKSSKGDMARGDSAGFQQHEGKHYHSTGPLIFINQADSGQLVTLPGIGPVLSGRIIKYRELLGGYYSKKQFLEVYQLTQERFDKINGLVCVDTLNLKLINLNHLDADSLPYHPYLTDYHFKAIISFRDLNGKFTRTGEVLENRLLPPEVYERVKPYLTVEEVMGDD